MKKIIELHFKSTVLLLMNLNIEEEFQIEINQIHTNFDKGNIEEALLYLTLLDELIIEKFEQ